MTNHHHHSKIDHSKILRDNLPKHLGYYHNAKSPQGAIYAVRNHRAKTTNDVLQLRGGSRDHHPHCEHGAKMIQSPNSSGQRSLLNQQPHHIRAHNQAARGIHHQASLGHMSNALGKHCSVGHDHASKLARAAGITKLNSNTKQVEMEVEVKPKAGGSTKHRRTKHRRSRHRRSE